MTKLKTTLFIFVVFVILRLILIFTFPPFVDESNYIWWGSQMIAKPELRFLSIGLWGKQPLPFWLFGYGSLLFNNFLVGARLVSLIISIPAFFILYFLVKGIKDHKTAIIALTFFTLCPYFIFHQATALVDGMLLSINIAVLAILFKLWRKFELIPGLILGLLLGICFWVKSTGSITIFLSFAVLIFFVIDQSKKSIKVKRAESIFSKLFIIFLVMTITAFFVILLTGAGDIILIVKSTAFFIIKPNQFANFAFRQWLTNFLNLFLSFSIYLTPVVLFSIFFLKKEVKKAEVRFLVFWFVFSISFIIFSASLLRMRYFLFSMAAFLPLLGLGTNNLLASQKNSSYLKVLIFTPLLLGSLLVVFYPARFFSLFLKDSVVYGERDYALGLPSGYGLRESTNYFDRIKPKGRTVILAFSSYYGSNTFSFLSLTYRFDKEVSLVPVTTDSAKKFRQQLEPLTRSAIIYFIGNSPESENAALYLKPIKVFGKPDNEDYIGLYEVRF